MSKIEIDIAEIPENAERWDCGCITWRKGKIFYFKPCPVSCMIKEVVKSELMRQPEGYKTLYVRVPVE